MGEKTPPNLEIRRFQIQAYLIVATKWVDPSQRTLWLGNAFGPSWKYGVVEINCLMQETASSWSLLTYYPYDNEDCTTMTYKTIATYTASNYTELAYLPMREFYPIKMRNMRKCPINIAVFPCAPYVFINTTNGQRHFDGIEVKIIEAVASSLNFTPRFVLPEDIYGNKSAYGVKSDCIRTVAMRIELVSAIFNQMT